MIENEKSKLTDVSHYMPEQKKDIEDRIKSFKSLTQNPYSFIINDYQINIAYVETELSLYNKLSNLIFNS